MNNTKNFKRKKIEPICGYTPLHLFRYGFELTNLSKLCLANKKNKKGKKPFLL